MQAADITQLPPRQPEEVVFHRTRVDGWKVVNEKTTAWVVKLDDQNVVAYTPSCTHLGCAYHWDEQQKYFLCPCHTSAFGLDGKVLMGPRLARSIAMRFAWIMESCLSDRRSKRPNEHAAKSIGLARKPYWYRDRSLAFPQ